MEQKLKTKGFLRLGILLLGISLSLWNCRQEDDIGDEQLVNTKQTELFTTVSIEESKTFFQNLHMDMQTSRANDPIGLQPDIDNITQEELSNTEEKLTVIPATTNYEHASTRIVQVRSLDGEIHTLLFNEIPEQATTRSSSSGFSGIISVTTLSGQFVDGYRVQSGQAVTQFSINVNYSGSLFAMGGPGDCDEDYNPFSIFCNNVLDEVVVTAPHNSVVAINNYGGGHDTCVVYCNYVWRYNQNGYYNYGNSYMNYLRSQPCPEGYVRDHQGNCVERDPCSELLGLQNNVSYMAKIDELKGKTGLRKETGYLEEKGGTFTSLSTSNSSHSLDILSTANTIGYVHTHLDNYETGEYDPDGNPKIIKPIRMFSPNDVITFLTIAKRSQNHGISITQVYATMVSSTGTYTLKFTGDPASIPNSFSEIGLNNRYKELMEDFSEERAFLKFLKNELGVEGIQLYKIKESGRIRPKTLNSNERVDTGDC